MKNISSKEAYIFFRGIPHRKRVILADVNIPYKFSIDRSTENLFFCINADEFSNQSFQSVVLNLNSGLASIIPGIRNGFASAVDQATGNVYLGGSDGIFKYNYSTNDIVHPPVVSGIDIFDMYFSDKLYFVDTCTQNLHIYETNTTSLAVEMKGNLIEHFVIDINNDLYYANPAGVFVLPKGRKSPTLLDRSCINIRGAATDVNGTPFFVARDGIYAIDKENEQLWKVLSVNNGNGLAFDKDNNIIFGEDRSVSTIIPC